MDDEDGNVLLEKNAYFLANYFIQIENKHWTFFSSSFSRTAASIFN